jgi:glycosyltransferase involved in cell wall biosynthesis
MDALAVPSPSPQPAHARLKLRAADAGPLTIVHVITRFVRGGADENTLLSCNAQVAAGHHVVLVFGCDNSDDMRTRLDPRVVQICLPALVRRIDPVNDARALVALAQQLARLKPDIVHTHTSKAGIVGRLAAVLAEARTVVHGVHIVPFVNVGPVERTVYLTLERLLAPLTDAFVCVSGEMRDMCLTSDVGTPTTHSVIPSGMDVARFRNAAPFSESELRAVFGMREGRPKLLVLTAALEPRKRVVEFLPVFARIVAQDPAARLAVLGEGVERLRILDAIETLELTDHVQLLGFRDDIERWLASADVCVFTSEHEGLPRAVVQYVLAGRPVVTTNLPGIQAVVHDGLNGFIIDEHDLDDMAAPILRLLRERQLARAFSAYARGLNLSAWSLENMIVSLEDVYRHVLDDHGEAKPTEGQPTWIL